MTRVLVVDDEAPIRLLCKVNLEAEGMSVLEAADGIEGLEQARLEQPDVILLDVMMPNLDGWGMAERLLADATTRDIPMIFLTARADARHEERALAVGGIDFVKKPFDPLTLAALIRSVLARVEGGCGEEVRRARLTELRELLG
jgi:CheY-like chemotaxis protein